MVGPFVMAALTEKSRDIQADPASIEMLVRNVSSEGLVTLETPGGSVLLSRHGRVSLQPKERCLPAADCTFRSLQKQKQAPATSHLPAIRLCHASVCAYSCNATKTYSLYLAKIQALNLST